MTTREECLPDRPYENTGPSAWRVRRRVTGQERQSAPATRCRSMCGREYRCTWRLGAITRTRGHGTGGTGGTSGTSVTSALPARRAWGLAGLALAENPWQGTAWSAPGAPRREGGLPVSKPGLDADTRNLLGRYVRFVAVRNARRSWPGSQHRTRLTVRVHQPQPPGRSFCSGPAPMTRQNRDGRGRSAAAVTGVHQILTRSARSSQSPSPSAVPNASWNSSRLRTMLARNSGGECGSMVRYCCSCSLRRLVRQQ